MSEADKLFEELGYMKIENKHQIVYVKDISTIVFLLNYKKIQYEFLRGCTYIVQNIEELKAINKKCEELGWL